MSNGTSRHWAGTETPTVLLASGRLIAVGFVLMILVLLVVPWRQTAQGEGRVLALSPTDRPQPVDAPVKGRVVKWHVIEGSVVKAGDPLVEIRDVDPDYVARLEEERAAVKQRQEAARMQSEAYETQAQAFEELKTTSVMAAKRKTEMAAQKLEASKQKLAAVQASLETTQLNVRRVQQLASEGLASTREVELAELAVAKARTEVNAFSAAVQEARAGRVAAEAEEMVKSAGAAAKVASSRAYAQKALSDAAKAAGELAKIEVQLARQSAREILAPTDGVVLELSGNQGGQIVKEGERLAVIVPQSSAPAVEVWVSGNDMPLISKGRDVRLQFEGWPAVQFAGWPSVAVGTFGAKVMLVDAQSRKDGKFRVLLVPGDDESSWPDARMLRPGLRTRAWIMLDEVRLGYELWRRANGFPASVKAPVKTSIIEDNVKKDKS